MIFLNETVLELLPKNFNDKSSSLVPADIDLGISLGQQPPALQEPEASDQSDVSEQTAQEQAISEVTSDKAHTNFMLMSIVIAVLCVLVLGNVIIASVMIQKHFAARRAAGLR